MDQALLSFDQPPSDALDRGGFEVGWDHGRHALVPPADLLLEGTPVGQGWRAARAVFGHRTAPTTRGVRQWLALRLEAWRCGAEFDTLQVTPHHLVQLHTTHCPVTRQALGGPTAGDQAAVITRLRNDAGYAAGNLATLSRLAARAKQGLDAAQALEQAQRLARDGAAGADGLDAAAWARLATLMSLAVPLPQVQAARIALYALPPNRVRVLNPAQGLQALLTLRLQAAGWSRRARAVADLLPRPSLRHDFNLFIGALAVPLMSIPGDLARHEARWALEDAWCDGRVQRRWAQFAVQMSEAESERLLQAIVDAGLAGTRTLLHEPQFATEGWALASRGRLLVSPRRAQPAIPGPAARAPAAIACRR